MNFQSIFPNSASLERGIKISSVSAGIRQQGRLDYVLFEFEPGTAMAGVFTQNKFCAAPVSIAKKNLLQRCPDQASYWLVNTGYANAGTGALGYQDALAVCKACAVGLNVSPEQVLPFSTGVIGERLPLARLVDACPKLIARLRAPSPSNPCWIDAATGIMTTDTRPKIGFQQFSIDGCKFLLCGIAKGAGMIHPNMATMLGFLVTDLPLHQDTLHQCLQIACDQSFNCISVDGDTSTNDALMIAALPSRSHEILDADLAPFQQALNSLCLDLALQIVRDAEGATKCVQLQVEGAASQADGRRVADTIATSPLVKTALFAGDPNWGRILAAVGRSGVDGLDISKVSLLLDQVLVFERGELAQSYDEKAAARVMAQSEFCIRVGLGQGPESVQVWTSDFSFDYVKINAEYRS